MILIGIERRFHSKVFASQNMCQGVLIGSTAGGVERVGLGKGEDGHA